MMRRGKTTNSTPSSCEGVRCKGIACIVASAFGFALMAFFVRLCDDYGPPVSCFQKGFFRNFVALLLAAAVFLRTAHASAAAVGAVPSESFHLSKDAGLTLLARCLFGAFGIFANFHAISHIQVGEAMALNKTAPLFTVLFSALLLGERPTRRQLVCLALAFLGAMLVVRPGFRAVGGSAAALGLASGLGAGVAYACVHRLGRLQVPGALIVVAFSAFSCLASVPFMVADFTPMTAAQFWILLGAGVGAAVGQFGITAAYRYAEPRTIAGYDYTGVVFSALFGFAFFGQVPDALSVIGFVLILTSQKR